jgi:hypothetical protein
MHVVAYDSLSERTGNRLTAQVFLLQSAGNSYTSKEMSVPFVDRKPRTYIQFFIMSERTKLKEL